MLRPLRTFFPLGASLLAALFCAPPGATAGRLDKPRFDVDVRITINNGGRSGTKIHKYSVENSKTETQRMSYEEREQAEKRIAFKIAAEDDPSLAIGPAKSPSAPAAPSPALSHVNTLQLSNARKGRHDSFAELEAIAQAKEKASLDAKIANNISRASGLVWSDPGDGSLSNKSVRTDVLPNGAILKYGKNADTIISRRYGRGDDWQLSRNATLKGEDKTPYTDSTYGHSDEHWTSLDDPRFDFSGNFTGNPIDVPEYPTRPTLSFNTSRFTEKFYAQSQKLSATASRAPSERFSPEMMTTALGERRYRSNKQNHALSMQDINRYNFRGSHATAPGVIPVSGPGITP
ncbi:MAG: hypothetical protein LBG65_00710 [Puniceicoccales bacterium]|jgi:hypothetical protein|nr:hypothetical protein [Puniceicoccales bacterium]